MLDRLRVRYEQRVIRQQGCWSWDGSVHTAGYGCFCMWMPAEGRSKLFYAHRVSMMLSGVSIPADQEILHLCHNPICSNPEHLAIGDRTANMVSSSIAGRMKKKIGPEDWPVIVSRRRSGEFYRQIAADYGCTVQAIRAVTVRHG